MGFHHQHGSQLAAAFDLHGVLHDLDATRRVAAWAYGQGEAAGGQVWHTAQEFGTLTGAWRDALAV